MALGVVYADPPPVVLHPLAQSVLAGDRVVLRASADPLVPSAARWWRDGEFVSGGSMPLLTIDNVGPEHQGYYRASFRNADGASWTLEAYLRVIYRQPGPGVRDRAFAPPPVDGPDIRALALAGAGRVLVAGDFQLAGRSHLARLLPDGSVDPSFNPGGAGPNDKVRAVVAVAGGFLIGGDFTTYNGVVCNAIALLDENGLPDGEFRGDLGFDNDVLSLAVDAEGGILAGGKFLHVRSDVGPLERSYFTRLLPDGRPDLNFAPDALSGGAVEDFAIDGQGRIVAVGSFTSASGLDWPRVARLIPNGWPDLTFSPGAGPNQVVRTLALADDGSIYIGGSFDRVQNVARGGFARLSPSGALDLDFVHDCIQPVRALCFDAVGRLLVGGRFTEIGGVALRRLVRFGTDGELDHSFEALGIDDEVRAIASQSDGGIVVAGEFGRPASRVFRVFGEPAVGVEPQILAGPELGQTHVGGSARLRVIAGGGGELSYQWCRDGLPLAGADGDELLLAPLSKPDSGAYSVRVSNAVGSAETAPVALLPRARLPGTEARMWVSGGGGAFAAGRVTDMAIQVDDSFPIDGLRVELDLDHPQLRDLEVSLVGADGREVPLIAKGGKSSQRVLAAAFDTAANAAISEAEPPFTGVFRPAGNLAQFVGNEVLGTWRLRLDDARPLGAAAGELNAWGVEFRAAADQPSFQNYAAAFGVALDFGADSNADGAPDFMHYAFGAAPDERWDPLWLAAGAGGYVFAHWRWPLGGDVAYTYESAAAAGAWESFSPVAIDRERFPGGLERAVYRMSADAPARLLRIRVAPAP